MCCCLFAPRFWLFEMTIASHTLFEISFLFLPCVSCDASSSPFYCLVSVSSVSLSLLRVIFIWLTFVGRRCISHALCLLVQYSSFTHHTPYISSFFSFSFLVPLHRTGRRRPSFALSLCPFTCPSFVLNQSIIFCCCVVIASLSASNFRFVYRHLFPTRV